MTSMKVGCDLTCSVLDTATIGLHAITAFFYNGDCTVYFLNAGQRCSVIRDLLGLLGTVLILLEVIQFTENFHKAGHDCDRNGDARKITYNIDCRGRVKTAISYSALSTGYYLFSFLV